MLLGVRVPHSVGSTNFVAMSCVESPHHGGSHPRLHPRQAGEEVRPLAASSPLHHRQASSPTHHHHNHHRHHQHHHHHHHHRNDRYAPIKRLALVQIHPPRNPNKPLTPFSISDILTGRANRGKSDRERQDGHRGRDDRDKQRPAAVNNHAAANPGQGNVTLGMGAIVRPWADSLSAAGRHSSVGSEQEESGSEEDEEIEVDDDPDTVKKFSADSSQSPLDALLQMTSKTFDGMDAASQHSEDSSRRDQLSLFSKSQPAKKRRKSRTAFTNQQIYELEKRFLYQKYLTPADRDEIASSLGLSNAQVITWFQNRRAKLKRDLEELKADVHAAKSGSPGSVIDPTDNASVYLDELNALQKNGPVKKKEESNTELASPTATNSSSAPSSPGSPLAQQPQPQQQPQVTSS